MNSMCIFWMSASAQQSFLVETEQVYVFDFSIVAIISNLDALGCLPMPRLYDSNGGTALYAFDATCIHHSCILLLSGDLVGTKSHCHAKATMNIKCRRMKPKKKLIWHLTNTMIPLWFACHLTFVCLLLLHLVWMRFFFELVFQFARFLFSSVVHFVALSHSPTG